MTRVLRHLARLHDGASERIQAEFPALRGALGSHLKRSEGSSGIFGACFSAAC